MLFPLQWLGQQHLRWVCFLSSRHCAMHVCINDIMTLVCHHLRSGLHFADTYSVGVNFRPVNVNGIAFGDVYVPGNESAVLYIPAQSPDSCNAACTFFSHCHAWTWKNAGNPGCHYNNMSACCFFKVSSRSSRWSSGGRMSLIGSCDLCCSSTLRCTMQAATGWDITYDSSMVSGLSGKVKNATCSVQQDMDFNGGSLTSTYGYHPRKLQQECFFFIITREHNSSFT